MHTRKLFKKFRLYSANDFQLVFKQTLIIFWLDKDLVAILVNWTFGRDFWTTTLVIGQDDDVIGATAVFISSTKEL
jgi:hypothetical protein